MRSSSLASLRSFRWSFLLRCDDDPISSRYFCVASSSSPCSCLAPQEFGTSSLDWIAHCNNKVSHGSLSLLCGVHRWLASDRRNGIVARHGIVPMIRFDSIRFDSIRFHPSNVLLPIMHHFSRITSMLYSLLSRNTSVSLYMYVSVCVRVCVCVCVCMTIAVIKDQEIKSKSPTMHASFSLCAVLFKANQSSSLSNSHSCFDLLLFFHLTDRLFAPKIPYTNDRVSLYIS